MFFLCLEWVWELLVFIPLWQSTLSLPLSLFLSSFSLYHPRVPSHPARLSVPICLFVSTVQTCRPCRRPPTFTTFLFLFSLLKPARTLPPQPYPTSPLLKYNLSVSSEKEISLQFHYLNLGKYGIRHCTLTCETAAKKRKWNKIEGSLFFQLGLEFVLCGVLSENENKCCDQHLFVAVVSSHLFSTFSFSGNVNTSHVFICHSVNIFKYKYFKLSSVWEFENKKASLKKPSCRWNI